MPNLRRGIGWHDMAFMWHGIHVARHLGGTAFRWHGIQVARHSGGTAFRWHGIQVVRPGGFPVSSAARATTKL
jgi:hypothetical protein